MLRLKWVLGSAAVLCAALNLGRAADDDKTYDLRGPAPEKGQVFLSKGTLKIKDADTTMKLMGMSISLKLTMVMTSEEEAKVLAVKGRDVTKCQTKIIKERADVTASLGGEDMEHTEPTALEKETVISERDGKGWKHTLVDTKPTDKQKKELDSRNGIENDDDLYPEAKVKVGHKWTVDASALNKLLGNSFTDVKGKVTQTFTKIEDLDDEKVAVIESNTKLTAKMKEDGEPSVDVEMEMKITTYKSLKTGLAVKEKFTGKIKMAGTVKMEDIKVEMTLSGPISGESTTKMK
jgi:hypothetical protein